MVGFWVKKIICPSGESKGAPLARDQPPLARDQPPLARDQPPLARDQPPLARDQPPLARDQPGFPPMLYTTIASGRGSVSVGSVPSSTQTWTWPTMDG